MSTSIGANLGYQGQSQFGVSLLGQYVMGFATDCVLQPGGQRQRDCTTAPLYATPYFNSSAYLTS